MPDYDFSLPPGVEVPDYIACDPKTCETKVRCVVCAEEALAALCRVVREQAAEKDKYEWQRDKAARWAGVDISELDEEWESFSARRRVREEGEDE